MIFGRITLPNSYKKDGWLAWAVCLFAFISNAVVVGIDRSYGESLEPVMKAFNATESQAVWVGSIHSSTQYFAAFLSSMLAYKIGFGPTIFIGSVSASIAFALATLAKSITVLAVLFGVVGGIALGFCYAPGNIICSYYFQQRRPLATGLAVTGGGFGIVPLAYFISLMNVTYGWKSWLTICSCICPLVWLLAITTWLLPPNCDKNDEDLGQHQSANEVEERYETYNVYGINLQTKPI